MRLVTLWSLSSCAFNIYDISLLPVSASRTLQLVDTYLSKDFCSVMRGLSIIVAVTALSIFKMLPPSLPNRNPFLGSYRSPKMPLFVNLFSLLNVSYFANGLCVAFSRS